MQSLGVESNVQRLMPQIQKIAQLTGWRAYLLAVLFGAASVLSLAPIFAWPIMFITLPGFILLLDGAVAQSKKGTTSDRLKKTALIGWAFGFGYFFASLFWIGEAFLVEAEKFAFALPFAISLLPAALGLYFALATAIAGAFWQSGLARIILLAITLTCTEWLRGQLFTGFPWNVLGYTLTGNEGLMQWASVFGAYGLTPLAVLIFSSPVLLAEHPVLLLEHQEGHQYSSRQNYLFPTAMIAILLTGMGLGYMRLANPPTQDVEGVLLRIVQPNTPQKEKWLPSKRREVFEQLIKTTANSTTPDDTGLKGVTHVIWPESAFPFLVLRTPEALSAIADLLPKNTTLLSGALRMVESKLLANNSPDKSPDYSADNSADNSADKSAAVIRRKIYNSMLAIDSEGQILSFYDKVHLVPFGEYLPFQHILEAIGLEQLTRLKGGLESGEGPRTITIPGLPKVIPLICYEIIFPNYANNAQSDQKWLLNLTNDAWFGQTSGPYQHFHQARVRAVETGIPVVRVANTGISAVIDPHGRIVKRLPLMTAGAINSPLPAPLPTTVYTTIRNMILWLELVALMLLLFAVIHRKGQEIDAKKR